MIYLIGLVVKDVNSNWEIWWLPEFTRERDLRFSKFVGKFDKLKWRRDVQISLQYCASKSSWKSSFVDMYVYFIGDNLKTEIICHRVNILSKLWLYFSKTIKTEEILSKIRITKSLSDCSYGHYIAWLFKQVDLCIENQQDKLPLKTAFVQYDSHWTFVYNSKITNFTDQDEQKISITDKIFKIF